MATSSMQPLTALQRLTALVFTSCEHSSAEEPLNLPATSVAVLSASKYWMHQDVNRLLLQVRIFDS